MQIKSLFKSNAPAVPELKFIGLSFLGVLLTIAMLSYLSFFSGYVWLMAPFGASCVLAFGLPDSPLAQPRSIIGGHCIATLVGLIALNLLGDAWWVAAIAVAAALAAMQLSRTLHAPAGANPLVVLMAHAPISFLFMPTLAGAVLIVAMACAINNLRVPHSYPRYWL
ncbi:MAG: HPP family protein [Sideroxydans sp.]|nr:HPP family protein [Sideroxydans sp.]